MNIDIESSPFSPEQAIEVVHPFPFPRVEESAVEQADSIIRETTIFPEVSQRTAIDIPSLKPRTRAVEETYQTVRTIAHSLIAEGGGHLSVSYLAGTLGCSRDMVHDVLNLLAMDGLVERHGKNPRYFTTGFLINSENTQPQIAPRDDIFIEITSPEERIKRQKEQDALSERRRKDSWRALFPEPPPPTYTQLSMQLFPKNDEQLSLTRTVLWRIITRILEFEIESGKLKDIFPTQSEIAERFGCSASLAQNVTKQLAETGHINLPSRKKGFRVSERFSIDENRDLLLERSSNIELTAMLTQIKKKNPWLDGLTEKQLLTHLKSLQRQNRLPKEYEHLLVQPPVIFKRNTK